MSTTNGSTGRVLAVAKKDYRDASQSRALWALVAVFVLLTTISAYVFVEAPELMGAPEDPTFEGLLFFTAAGTALFVPLAAIIVCYKSLAGERELGSIKVIMSLPTTRGDVFFGKVLGRAAVITTALGVGLVLGVGFGAALLGSIGIGATLVFLVVTVLFAAVYTGIIVSLSAMTGSTVKATTYALGFFVVFELLWDVVPLGILYVVEGFSLPTQLPDWFMTLMMVSPATAYFSAVDALLPETANGPDETGVTVDVNGEYGDVFYASAEMGIVFLALWLVVPLAIGYYRFTRADL